jgi:rhomboid protease GluP
MTTLNTSAIPKCVNCGRELPAMANAPNICPECRQMIVAHAQAPARGWRWLVAQMPLTAAIVGMNVLVYIGMVLTGVSALAPSIADLLKWGALSGQQTLAVQPWRILTSNYVHIGLLHIALNMWCLWNLGALAERIFDRWTYFLTYTACGLAGSIVSLWWHPIGVGAGASGAIFGLAGALISALYLGHLPVNPQALKSILRSLLSFAGYNLFFGTVVAGIDNSAHIGGLLCGLILGGVLAPRLTAPRDDRILWERWVFIIATLVLFSSFRLVRYAVFTGVVHMH